MADDDTTNLIAQIVEGFDAGSMVTKFVIIAEVIEPDGHRVLWTDTHEGAARWDTYGMLEWAMTQEHAEHINASYESDEP